MSYRRNDERQRWRNWALYSRELEYDFDESPRPTSSRSLLSRPISSRSLQSRPISSRSQLSRPTSSRSRLLRPTSSRSSRPRSSRELQYQLRRGHARPISHSMTLQRPYRERSNFGRGLRKHVAAFRRYMRTGSSRRPGNVLPSEEQARYHLPPATEENYVIDEWPTLRRLNDVEVMRAENRFRHSLDPPSGISLGLLVQLSPMVYTYDIYDDNLYRILRSYCGSRLEEVTLRFPFEQRPGRNRTTNTEVLVTRIAIAFLEHCPNLKIIMLYGDKTNNNGIIRFDVYDGDYYQKTLRFRELRCYYEGYSLNLAIDRSNLDNYPFSCFKANVEPKFHLEDRIVNETLKRDKYHPEFRLG